MRRRRETEERKKREREREREKPIGDERVITRRRITIESSEELAPPNNTEKVSSQFLQYWNPRSCLDEFGTDIVSLIETGVDSVLAVNF